MNTITTPPIMEAALTVTNLVAQRFDCTQAEVVSLKRGVENISKARHMAMWLLRLRGWGYTTIGEYFRRNHAAVMHGCNAVNNRFDVEPRYKQMWPEYADFRVALKNYEPVVGEESWN